MSHVILNPIDNTKLEGKVDESYQKGVSEYNRLFIQNQGTDANNNIIHYFPWGSILVGDKIAVKSEHIFLKNGYLAKRGVIVEKYYISKQKNGVLLSDEKYFRVLESNLEEVNKNDLVIVMADQGFRFNFNKKEFFFVASDKILIVIGCRGVKAGPDNLLLEAPKQDMLGLEDNKPNKGILDNKTYYFSDALYDIVIAHTPYMAVAKKDIKLYLD